MPGAHPGPVRSSCLGLAPGTSPSRPGSRHMSVEVVPGIVDKTLIKSIISFQRFDPDLWKVGESENSELNKGSSWA